MYTIFDETIYKLNINIEHYKYIVLLKLYIFNLEKEKTAFYNSTLW